MKSIQLYNDVEVTVRELVSSTLGLHTHHYFELIYVLSGSGIHNINNNKYKFSKGDVFLLTPEDAHSFKILTPTKFCNIDFTKSFFSKSADRQNEKMDVSDFFKKLEYIFHNHHNVKGHIISAADKNIFEVLINQLIAENKNKQLFGEIVTQNIVFLLLHLIARNIQLNISNYSKKQNPKNKVHEIASYIQQNIYNKESIKLENLAIHFNKTADHLSRYFKTETGNTIKDYITRYRISLAQTRLKFSELSISEIAYELNFTDESHLNKAFKSIVGKTAKQFKNENMVKYTQSAVKHKL